jgi:hypothetical protein
MRKRALDADQGRAGAGMSGNKQEQLEKKEKYLFFLYMCNPYIGFYSKTQK